MKQAFNIQEKLYNRAKVKELLKEVKNHEYYIVPIGSVVDLYTTNLGSDIAYTLHSTELGKVAMARQLNYEQLREFCNQYLSLLDRKPLKENIIMQVLGGDESITSEKAQQLLDSITSSLDLDTAQITIKTCDVGKTPHWNSAVFSTQSGNLYDGDDVPRHVLIGLTEFVTDAEMHEYLN